MIFSAPGVREIVSAPAKRPIRPVYIKQFVALIDAAGDIGTKKRVAAIWWSILIFPSCTSDGETIEEAIANGREALRDCVEGFHKAGRKIPKPC